MGTWRELEPKELKYFCNEIQLPKENCKIEPVEEIIGQDRAVKSIEFGLIMKQYGYNVFISGIVGTGKTTYAKKAVSRIAEKGQRPNDWVYVNNFVSPDFPIAICLPTGMGIELRNDMEKIVEEVKIEVNKAFSSENYEKTRSQIIKQTQEIRGEVFSVFNQKAEEMGVAPQWTSTGFVGVPIMDNKPISSEEYQKLSKIDREQIEKRMMEVHNMALDVVRKIQKVDREMRENLKRFDEEIALYTVERVLNEFLEKYRKFDEVCRYLKEVQTDMIKNLNDFKTPVQEEENALNFMGKRKDDIMERYKVNVFVDNKEQKGAPVVFEINPTYYNLFGRVEYENRMNALTTDFTLIKPGALHKANGGYLILNAKDLLMSVGAWEGLKRALRTRQLSMENLGEQYSLLAMASLRPQPIPLNVKIILIGNPMIYTLLSAYDEDFGKLFRIHADFDVEMKNNAENLEKLHWFINSVIEQEQLKSFNITGITALMEYCSRLAGSQDKLSTKFKDIVELACEADAWATKENKTDVDGSDVKKAIYERAKRENKIEEKIHEMFEKEMFLLDTEGEKIGQINGLAVINTGAYVFGKPSKITANTFMGRTGIINIEREIQISGSIHSKGVLTLAGYLGEKYAQNEPLSLSCSLTFEQEYSGVDGDSASSTELYAIISSLAGVPLKQYIAVTGSVNQKGEIQPVGGVTEKIEGYFAVCKLKELTGKQGVLIPDQNIKDLNLKDKLIEAIKNKQFHIYTAKTIDDGIELLTGKKAGIPDENHNYPQDTVHNLAMQKLKKYIENFKKLGYIIRNTNSSH